MCKLGTITPSGYHNSLRQECSSSTKATIVNNDNSSSEERNNLSQNRFKQKRLAPSPDQTEKCPKSPQKFWEDFFLHLNHNKKQHDDVPSRSAPQKSDSNQQEILQHSKDRKTADRKSKHETKNEKKFSEGLFLEEKKKKQKESVANTAIIKRSKDGAKKNIWQEIRNDCTKGDKKLLRAIGRTAFVNAVVAITALTGGATGVACFATGGAITVRRFVDGLIKSNDKEMIKSLTVYGCAGTASLMGQIVAGALMTTIAGASVPVAAALAFGVGCASGITAGALSEWGVDCAWVEIGGWLRRQGILNANAVMEGPCNNGLSNYHIEMVLLQSASSTSNIDLKSGQKCEIVLVYDTDTDTDIESVDEKMLDEQFRATIFERTKMPSLENEIQDFLMFY